MTRKKIISRPLDKLNNRILGLKSIKEDLALTNGFSVHSCSVISTDLQAAIDEHFMLSVAADEKRKLIQSLEKKANAASKHSLLGVINDFGDDSSHVTKLGGIRVSERAKPTTVANKAAKAAKKAVA